MGRVFHTREFQYTDYELVTNMQLRGDDVRELCAGLGIPEDPKAAAERVAMDCLVFPNTFLTFCEGELFCVSGVVPTNNPTMGTIWAVGTDLIDQGGLDVLAWGIKNVAMLFKFAPILENWIDARNESHIRWLKAMKFTFTGLSIDINGYPFLHFARVWKGKEV